MELGFNGRSVLNVSVTKDKEELVKRHLDLSKRMFAALDK